MNSFFFISKDTLGGISSFSRWWDESSRMCCPVGGGLRWTWNAQRGRAWYFPRACLHLEFGYFRPDLIRTLWAILLAKCNAVVQAVSSRLYKAEPRVRSKASVCDVCGGQSAAGTGLSPSTSVPNTHPLRPVIFDRCTIHFITLRPMPYNLNNWQRLLKETSVCCACPSPSIRARVFCCYPYVKLFTESHYRIAICLLTPNFLQCTFLVLVLSSTVFVKCSS